jgi:hypothetical protein
VGSIQKFKDGLWQGILRAILNKETWPTTIDQWKKATRRKVRWFSIIKEALGNRPNNFISNKQAKWRSSAQQLKSSIRKKDEVVPMEIDAGQIWDKDLKKEAKLRRLQTKGRCYGCGKQGHLWRDCPDRPKGARNPPSYTLKAQSTELPPEEEEEHQPTLEEIIRAVGPMDKDQKCNYLDGFLLKPEDF